MNEVTALSVSGTQSLALLRNDDRTWRMTSPIQTENVIRHLVDNFVESVIGMRAPGPPQKAIDGTFDMIQKTIVIQLDSGRVVTLEIGQKYGNGGHGHG